MLHSLPWGADASQILALPPIGSMVLLPTDSSEKLWPASLECDRQKFQPITFKSVFYPLKWPLFFPYFFHELCPKWNKSSILHARLMKPSVDVLREEKNGNWKKKNTKPPNNIWYIYSSLWFTTLMTPPFWQALFINTPFLKNSQLWHNRRHLEITALRFAFNCFRAASRSTFFSLVGLFSNSFSTTTLSLSPPPFFSSSPPPPFPPSPGQLLIRGRNDRCFAHQQCHPFCLHTKSRCAVHIYFRAKKKKNSREKKWLKKIKPVYLVIYGRMQTNTSSP